MKNCVCQCERGFTLIELIVVIILVGVLGVIAMPRFSNSDLNARGFHDETLALLRYAQKQAIAQRRTVCVAFTSTTATLTIATAAAAATCASSAILVGPRGESPATVTAKTGITYVATPMDFTFNGLGQPSSGKTIQVANNGTAITLTITVEASTGYVHD
jgi:MSHA pilin protein MshC